MTNIKQKIKIRGETYYYQNTHAGSFLAHYGIKGKYPIEGNADYHGIKVELVKGDRMPEQPRTLSMWLRREHHKPEYEWHEYATHGYQTKKSRRRTT